MGICEYCPFSLFYYEYSESGPTTAEREELFHQPCHPCSLSAFQDERLCPICQHLRLRHLVTCVSVESRRRFLFHLRQGLVQEDVVPRCPLCRLVWHMILHAFDKNRVSAIMRSDHNICLFLGPLDEHKSSVAADIYLQYAEENGQANLWVGDLHIDISNGTVGYLCKILRQ